MPFVRLIADWESTPNPFQAFDFSRPIELSRVPVAGDFIHVTSSDYPGPNESWERTVEVKAVTMMANQVDELDAIVVVYWPISKYRVGPVEPT